MTDAPRLYLVAPPTIDDRLSAVLDAVPVACLRVGEATAEAARAVASSRDVPVVLDGAPGPAKRLGLDGVHLRDVGGLRDLRRSWGDGPIIGACCGLSRHDGMVAGEDGADYVCFSPAAEAVDLLAWWAEAVEVPVVAEGGLDGAAIRSVAPYADFVALGEEIWMAEDPAAQARALMRAAG